MFSPIIPDSEIGVDGIAKSSDAQGFALTKPLFKEIPARKRKALSAGHLKQDRRVNLGIRDNTTFRSCDAMLKVRQESVSSAAIFVVAPEERGPGFNFPLAADLGRFPFHPAPFPWSIRQLDPNRLPPDDAGRVGWAIEAGPGDYL